MFFTMAAGCQLRDARHRKFSRTGDTKITCSLRMPSPIFMEVHHSKQIPQWEVAAPDSANTGPTLPGEREH